MLHETEWLIVSSRASSSASLAVHTCVSQTVALGYEACHRGEVTGSGHKPPSPAELYEKYAIVTLDISNASR
jgi:hypothetical protein